MFAILLVLLALILIFPSVGAQYTPKSDVKIGLNEPLKHETFENFTIFDASKSKILTVFGAYEISNFAVQETKFPSTPKFEILENTSYFLTPENQGFSRILSDNDISEVNAASTVKAKIWYKHWYKLEYKHWYRQWHKHWYKSYGRWHYYWTYNWEYTWKYTWKYSWKYKLVSTVSKSSVGAYNVVVTSKYVYATGRCTCCLYTNYRYHTRVFYNYNPATHHWGVLYFEEGPAGLTSPEGLWVAGDTDMDFCLVHGKSHDYRGVYLVPYNGVINGKKVVNGYFTGTVVTNST